MLIASPPSEIIYPSELMERDSPDVPSGIMSGTADVRSTVARLARMVDSRSMMSFCVGNRTWSKRGNEVCERMLRSPAYRQTRSWINDLRKNEILQVYHIHIPNLLLRHLLLIPYISPIGIPLIPHLLLIRELHPVS